MKAYTYKKYGGPEVLNIEELPKPTPSNNEVLIEVKALSLNPAEWHQLKASIWLLRLKNGLFSPRQQILGADVAGVIVEVGKDVKSLSVGDKVFGRNFSGGIAEFTCLKEDKAAKIPNNITFEQAAAIPLASNTALYALKHMGKVQPNDRVLINGASGGIGTYLVQLARYFGAEVTAVCSEKNAKVVKSLGAAEVIDYTKQDFTRTEKKFNLIIDLVGNRSIDDIKRSMLANGRCIMVGYSNFKNMFHFILKGAILNKLTSKSFFTVDVTTQKKDLNFISELIAKREIKSIIENIYDFQAVPDAFHRLGSRRVQGKIVVKL